MSLVPGLEPFVVSKVIFSQLLIFHPQSIVLMNIAKDRTCTMNGKVLGSIEEKRDLGMQVQRSLKMSS